MYRDKDKSRERVKRVSLCFYRSLHKRAQGYYNAGTLAGGVEISHDILAADEL